MAYAASRLPRLSLTPSAPSCSGDIDSETVDFVDNYDNTMLRASALLPTTYPNVLVSANMGIAVGMASNILRLQPPRGL